MATNKTPGQNPSQHFTRETIGGTNDVMGEIQACIQQYMPTLETQVRQLAEQDPDSITTHPLFVFYSQLRAVGLLVPQVAPSGSSWR